MGIKVGEVGKLFNYGTFFDLSSFTLLTLKFTSPLGTVTTLTSPTRVSAPSVDVTDNVLGTLPADTYMQITTEATDFTEVGTWTVCGIYQDATPKKFDGDDATFEVEAGCD